VRRYDDWLMLADRYRHRGPLVEMMESMTHREFEARLEWIRQEREREIEKPSLMNHYLMQIAAEVRRSWVEDPSGVDMQQMRLVAHQQLKGPVDREEATRRSKAKWCGWLNVRR